MKIQLVRLVSGEEVVGDVVENDDHVLIKDGYSLVAPEPGKIAFIPFMAYCKKQKDGFKISKEFVMFVGEPIDEMVSQVREMNSGIIQPSTKPVVM